MDIPTEILLFKPGVNETTKGTFLFNPLLGEQIQFQSHIVDKLPIDINHLSFQFDTDAKNHRAVGWFKLETREDGLWATQIEWTEEGKELVSSKAFLYTSPTFYTSEDGMTIIEVAGLSLTNNPATYNVSPLVLKNKISQQTIKEINMLFNKKNKTELGEKPEEEKKEEGELVSLSKSDFEEIENKVEELSKLLQEKSSEIQELKDENKELLITASSLEPVEKEYWMSKPIEDVKVYLSQVHSKKVAAHNKKVEKVEKIKEELSNEKLPTEKSESETKVELSAIDKQIVDNIKYRLKKLYQV